MDQAALDTLRPFFIAWSALVGAVVGSFLNVVIARVPAGLSVVSPRSRCPRCLAPIAWYDNVPVLSWLLLRARCRGCGLPISARYPAVELLLAGLAGLAAWRHGPSAAAAVELTFMAILVALAFIDLDTWLLPWSLTLPLAGLALGAGALRLTPAGDAVAAALGGALGFTAFLLVHLVGEKVFHREALGFGDVVLLGGLGAFLGPRGLLPVILLSSLQGAVIGAALLLLGKGEPGPAAAEQPLHSPAEPAEGQPDEAGPAQAGGLGGPSEPPRRDRQAEGRPDEAGPERAGGLGGPSEPPRRDRQAEGRPDEAGPERAGGLGGPSEPPQQDWIPPRHAIPYGPFLALAALEWLLLSGPLTHAVPALRIFLAR